MVCKHLKPVEDVLIEAGIEETFRGQAWLKNFREWVYFRCVLNRASLRERLGLPPCVVDHEHLGTHDGQEAGFICELCHDGIMGTHSKYPVGPQVS